MLAFTFRRGVENPNRKTVEHHSPCLVAGPFTDPLKALADATFKLLEEAVIATIDDVRREVFRLATGDMHSSPFDSKVLDALRSRCSKLLEAPAAVLIVDEGQPFLLGIGAVAEEVRGSRLPHLG